ncbi:MAG: nucleotidyl transferase AbiEii/AbiGii toxin family protein [Planctomycetota bacterium]
MAASIQQRLLDLDPDRREDPNARLTRYALERLLYRISKSSHSGSFILKGAMLFIAWSKAAFRTTRDLDLLGEGDLSAAQVRAMFEDICGLAVEPDGLVYQTSAMSIAPIREEADFHGWRIELWARMKNTRIRIRVDIGLGDAVSPHPEWIVYPTLLENMPAPRIRAYRRETVVAEKFQAMVTLGLKNSRMKDFYDCAILAERFLFHGPDLVLAMQATFDRRGILLPVESPTAFTDAFARDKDKQTQWDAFLGRMRLGALLPSFTEVVTAIREFLLPVMKAAAQRIPFDQDWPPGGPWRKGA